MSEKEGRKARKNKFIF